MRAFDRVCDYMEPERDEWEAVEDDPAREWDSHDNTEWTQND